MSQGTASPAASARFRPGVATLHGSPAAPQRSPRSARASGSLLRTRLRCGRSSQAPERRVPAATRALRVEPAGGRVRLQRSCGSSADVERRLVRAGTERTLRRPRSAGPCKATAPAESRIWHCDRRLHERSWTVPFKHAASTLRSELGPSVRRSHGKCGDRHFKTPSPRPGARCRSNVGRLHDTKSALRTRRAESPRRLRTFTACDSGLALGLGRAPGTLRAHRAQRHPGRAAAASFHGAGARVGPRNSGGKLVPRLARLAARRRLRILPIAARSRIAAMIFTRPPPQVEARRDARADGRASR